MSSNIIDLALGNENNFSEQFKKLQEDYKDQPMFEEFIDYLNDYLKISLNIKHQTFLKSLIEEEYKCAYEVFSNQQDQIRHFGNRSENRIKFDEAFTNGQKFKYLALNSGNTGIPFWGHYCVIFNCDEFQNDCTVILMRNSLEKANNTGAYYYFDSENNLNIEMLKIELCPMTYSKEIVSIKHHHKIAEIAKSKWCDLICHSEENIGDLDYIEIITSQTCHLKDNFILRFKEKEVELIFDYLESKFDDIDLGKSWKITVEEFQEFILAYETYKFQLETV